MNSARLFRISGEARTLSSQRVPLGGYVQSSATTGALRSQSKAFRARSHFWALRPPVNTMRALHPPQSCVLQKRLLQGGPCREQVTRPDPSPPLTLPLDASDLTSELYLTGVGALPSFLSRPPPPAPRPEQTHAQSKFLTKTQSSRSGSWD